MKVVTSFVLMLFCCGCFGQFSTNALTVNLGVVTNPAHAFTTFHIENEYDQSIDLVSIRTTDFTEVYSSKMHLGPKESFDVLVKVNPKKLGSLIAKVAIYASNAEQPFEVKVKANVRSLMDGNVTDCYLSNSSYKKVANVDQEYTVVRILDKHTNRFIKSAKVILSTGFEKETYISDKHGLVYLEKDPGRYQFLVSANDYNETDTSITFTDDSKLYVIFLESKVVCDTTMLFEMKTDPGVINVSITDIEEEMVLEDTVVEQVNKVDIKANTNQLQPLPRIQDKGIKETVGIVDADTNKLQIVAPVGHLPLNVVLLLDKSSSMRQGQRIDLLKRSVFEIISQMNQNDLIGMVEYGSNADVLVTSGFYTPDSMMNVIGKVQYGGTTKIGRGLEQAFTMAKLNFDPLGNNLIILITDGSFVISSPKLIQLINEYRAMGIFLSVVGLDNPEWTSTSLNELVNIGGGKYIHITKPRDIEEIMNHVFLKR